MDLREPSTKYLTQRKYEHTELGDIPEDWRLVSVGSVARFKSGEGISVSNLRQESSDTPIPVYGGNGIAGYTRNPLVREQVVVIGRVGQKCGEVYCTTGPAWISDNALYPQSFDKDVDIEFFALALKRAGLNDLKNRNDLPLVTQSILHAVQIPIPARKTEQAAIAKAVSDADAYVKSVEDLVLKKRRLRQAVVQELFSGRRRLPGFRGQWASMPLEEVLSYERPDRYLVRSTDYSESGETPVLTANKSFVLGYTDEEFGVCDEVPVILFDDFTTTSKYVDFPFKVKSSAIKLLRPKHDDVSLEFVFNAMQLLRFPVGDHKRYYISDFQRLQIRAPDHKEQIAIAAVLYEMDAEIDALELKMAKARSLQQGMMQKLLTGRIRLK